ncbi:MAG: acyltransferase [Flavobacterium sp.]|nr:MAG: acyltransferase [Flavobacterium sp.]
MNSTKTIPSLNGIRAICIVLVIGSHAHHASNFPLGVDTIWNYFFNGALGVTVFFVLSGFLITYLLLKEEEENHGVSLPNFYFRRAIRIFPVYYFLLFTYFLFHLAGIIHIPLSHWLTSLTYTKNFGYGSWIDGHLWSLAVEEQFYLVWPLIFKFASRRNRELFAFAIVFISPVFRAISYKYLGSGFTMMSFFTNMDCLMIGCLSAIFLPRIMNSFNRYKQNQIRLIAMLLIVAVWYLQINFIVGFLTVPFGRTLTSLCAAALIVSFGFFKYGIGYKFLNLKFINYLGILSYSIYIWQQMFFSDALGIFSKLPYNYLFIFVVAMTSYHFVEKPILKLRSNLIRRNAQNNVHANISSNLKKGVAVVEA